MVSSRRVFACFACLLAIEREEEGEGDFWRVRFRARVSECGEGGSFNDCFRNESSFNRGRRYSARVLRKARYPSHDAMRSDAMRRDAMRCAVLLKDRGRKKERKKGSTGSETQPGAGQEKVKS